MPTVTRHFARSLAVASLLAAPLLVSPLGIAKAATPQIAASPAAATSPTTATTKPGSAKMSGAPGTAASPRGETVEQRITTLHRELKITADQEKDWNAVAQSMRDNANNMQQLVDQTHNQGGQTTALDDLDTYQKFAQGHADGVKNLIGPFTTLYNEMTPDQKKNADLVFNNFHNQAVARRGSRTSG
jgi:periplasmic protein CpxP/Spy